MRETLLLWWGSPADRHRHSMTERIALGGSLSRCTTFSRDPPGGSLPDEASHSEPDEAGMRGHPGVGIARAPRMGSPYRIPARPGPRFRGAQAVVRGGHFVAPGLSIEHEATLRASRAQPPGRGAVAR